MSLKNEELRIEGLLEMVGEGSIRLPGFQRSFVWTSRQRTLLLDSLYRGYPIGSVLLWRTAEAINGPGAFALYESPLVAGGTPVDYVLDGQQRLATIAIAFKSGLVHPDTFFDLAAGDHPQTCRFVEFSDHMAYRPNGVDEVDYARYVPLRGLLTDDEQYQQAMDRVDTRSHQAVLELHRRFVRVGIHSQVLKHSDHASVAMSFRRLNQEGTALDDLHVLQAISWSNEFDFREGIHELVRDLFGLEPGARPSENQTAVILSSLAAWISGSPDIKAVVSLSGEEIRDQLSAVDAALRSALDFLRAKIGIASAHDLPTAEILIPLSTLFAHLRAQRRKLSGPANRSLVQWVWRTLLSRRYLGSSVAPLMEDVDLMSSMGRDEFRVVPHEDIAIASNIFEGPYSGSGRAYGSRLLVLLLHHRCPQSLLSGLELSAFEPAHYGNRVQRHHIFPRQFLTRLDNRLDPEVQANITLISAEDNREIADQSPELYLADVDRGVAATNFIDPDAIEVSQEGYRRFLVDRSRVLAEYAATLCNGYVVDDDEALHRDTAAALDESRSP